MYYIYRTKDDTILIVNKIIKTIKITFSYDTVTIPSDSGKYILHQFDSSLSRFFLLFVFSLVSTNANERC